MTRKVAGSSPARRVILHHYCIVREDVPWGVQAAQLAHAAGQTGGPAAIGAHVVVLGVPDEATLERVRARRSALGVPHRAIHEPDRPWFGALMAIGIEPMCRRNPHLRRAVARLSLLHRVEP